MDDPKTIIPIVHATFKTTVNNTSDFTIKLGLHNVFVKLIADPIASKEDIRLAIVKALDILAKKKPKTLLSAAEDSESEASTREDDDKKIQAKYFSSIKGGLVEFFINGEDKYETEVHGKASLDKTKTATPQETMNEKFKLAAINSFNSFSPGAVEKLVLSGVIMTLKYAESYEGMFMDTYTKHHALFGKLKRVWEKEGVETLAANDSNYSAWFAVDEMVAKYDQEKEDEARMRMG